MEGSNNDKKIEPPSDSRERLVWQGKWDDLLVQVSYDPTDEPGSYETLGIPHRIEIRVEDKTVSVARSELLQLAQMLLAAADWVDEHLSLQGDEKEAFERRSSFKDFGI